MQKRNNLLLALLLAMLGFLAAIPLPWFTLLNGESALGIFPSSLRVTGLTGTITMFFQAPIWLLLVLSTLSTSVVTANLLGFTSIPRLLPLMVLVFCGVHYVSPFFIAGDRLITAVGPVVALAATLTALAFTFIGNRPLVEQDRP